MLIGILVCLYFHFSKEDKKEVVIKEDTLSTRLSAMDKKSMASQYAHEEEAAPDALVQTQERQDDHEAQDSSEEASDGDDELAQLPWEEIEEGWKTQLKDYLVTVSPEHAEEMFSAYVEEKRKYMERVDFQENGSGVTEESPADEKTDSREPAAKGIDVEAVHEENLREIFGEHYAQVRSLHDEYVESVQYMNRSSVRFTISL